MIKLVLVAEVFLLLAFAAVVWYFRHAPDFPTSVSLGG